jgi:hypothetical protein
MYERLTSRNWKNSIGMRPEIYKRLALLEDGIEAGDIAFVKDLRDGLKERLGDAEKRKCLSETEIDLMEWVLGEIRS